MKTFSVNKNSWHYKMNLEMCQTNEMLKHYNYAEKYVQSKDNFCSYWRMTLFSMFKIAFIFAGITVLLFGVLFVLYNIGHAFVYNLSTALVFLAFIIGISLFIIGIAFFSDWITKRKRIKLNKILHSGETETSLAKAKYSSWKNGVCVKVEFKE